MEGNRQFKDSVFTWLMADKARIIELYNALEGTNYDMDTNVEILTLENVLFLGRYNDLCFMIDGKFVILVEHQSSINQNMPLRALLYLARAYEKILQNVSVYKEKLLKIPTPEFFVFYNGTKPYPVEAELKLSDAFIEATDTLELTVKVININYHEGSKLLEQSPTLKSYSYFVDCVRQFRNQGHSLTEALESSVKKCVKEGILSDFLKNHSSEVFNMLFEEFNLEDALRIKAEEAKEEGKEEEKTMIARNMKSLNLPISIIVQSTGLPESIIAKL